MILASLAAVASAAPQIVPYEHVEIPAEPYIHEEPELDALSLGIINRNNAVAAPVAAPVAVAPQQFAAPVAPQQFAAPVAGVWTGSCINNLGQGVPCRAEAQPAQAVAPQQFAAPVAPQQFIPQAQPAQAVAPQQFAAPVAPQ